jgi:hypothetical protein
MYGRSLEDSTMDRWMRVDWAEIDREERREWRDRK